MNVERTAGVVLRVRPLTESSLIVHWVTREFGRVATVAKGARRAKSPFRGQIDLFYLTDLAYSRSRRSDLHLLREARLVESHAALRRDLGCLRQASYCAALIEQTTELDAPLPTVFGEFTGLLGQLPKQPPQPQALFAFEVKLLQELGLKPNFDKTRLSAGARRILENFLKLDWPAVFQIRPSAAQTAEIRLFLHGFLIYHLERIPHGRAKALESS
jgi:DNA repair protein RecO (recombination protein O)